MAAINPSNTMNFIPAAGVLAEVKDELSSYNASGLLDPGAFYGYIHTLLHNLGAAVYQEQEALICIDKYVGKMPGNFQYIWDAYKVKNCDSGSNNFRDVSQGGYAFYTDVTSEIIAKHCGYEIEVPPCLDYTAKITVRDYMRQPASPCYYNFCTPELLGFGLTPESGLYDKCSPMIRCRSQNKINITGKTISATFYEGWILLRYFGIAIDPATTLPMVPENANIERALVYDIEYRTLRKMYINNTVPDLERKVAMVSADALDAFQTASNELKTPSFGRMIKAAQMNNNRFAIFQMRRTDRVWPVTF